MASVTIGLAVVHDEIQGKIDMEGPLFCHLEFAASYIREIARQADVPPHEVFADIARVL